MFTLFYNEERESIISLAASSGVVAPYPTVSTASKRIVFASSEEEILSFGVHPAAAAILAPSIVTSLSLPFSEQIFLAFSVGGTDLVAPNVASAVSLLKK